MRLTTLMIGALMFACTPGSLKLGDDPELETTSATEGTSEPTSAGETTETGEPAPEGELEWRKIFNDVAGYDVAVGPDGTFVVIGERGYTPQGDGGVFESRWIGKYGPDGTELWLHETLNVGMESYPIPLSVSVGPDGDIFLAVVDYSTLEGGGNAVVRLDPDGEELWSVGLGGRVGIVEATPDGGVIFGGGKSVAPNNTVAWVQALDAAGAVVWEQTYGDPEMRGSSVGAIAFDGEDVILAGSMGVAPDSSQAAAWLHRAALGDGAEIWDQVVSAAVATDFATGVGVTADGTILALVQADGQTVRAYSPGGSELWQFTPTIADGGGTLAVASDGAFTLTDGLYLPIEDPNACFGVFSPCPVRMRVEHRGADRSLLWQATSEECRAGTIAATLPNDGVLVLANCSGPGDGDEVLGVHRFAP